MAEGLSIPQGFSLEQEGAVKQQRPELAVPPGFSLEGAETAEPAARERSGADIVDDVIRSLASGATGALADEFAAYMSTLTGFGGLTEGDSYEEELGAQRARQKEISPWVQVPGEIIGAVGTTGATSGLGAPAALTRITAQLPGWAKAAGLGGLWGGLFGFGGSEGGTKERLKGAGVGGGLGLALGPAGYYAGRGLEMGGRVIGSRFGQRLDPEGAARRTIADAFAADEIPMGRAAARLRELGPQTTLADVGGANVRGLVRGASGLSGATKNRVETILKARGTKEAERIARAIEKGFQPTAFYEAADTFLRNMREKAGPLYRAAYERYQSVMTPALNRWLTTSPKAAQALREARAIVAEQRARGEAKYLGAVDEELLAATRAARDVGIRPPTDPAMEPLPGPIRGFSLETWQLIKEGLERVADSPRYKNPLTEGYNKAGREIIASSGWLVKQLDKATGGKEKSLYAKARRFYAGEAEALGALREGRKAINTDPEAIVRSLKKLSETGQQAYRSGFARALKDIADKTSDPAGIARRIWGNARNRARIQAAFPDQKSANEFAHSMAVELIFRDTELGIMAGSRTAPMLAEMTAAQKGGGVIGTLAAMGGAAATGGQGGIIVAGMRARVARRIATGLLGRENPAYYRALGRMLISRNQNENRFVFDHLRRLSVSLMEKAGILARVLTVAGGVAGGRMGRERKREEGEFQRGGDVEQEAGEPGAQKPGGVAADKN